jgi:predicted RNA-binding Zn-ribbon protein involved in translation (DUF1610 family)
MMSGAERTTQAARPKQFPCGQCGAALTYQPGTAHLRCPYCGHKSEIAEGESPVKELDFRAHLAMLAEAEPVQDTVTLKCESCRAQVQPAANVTATACPFCGAHLVAIDEYRRLIRPRLLLPFHVSREQAWKAYRDWITSLWFAPNEVKRYARSEHRLQGMYCPYWTYDSTTTTAYSGMRGDHYWVTSGHGKHRRRQRRTRWRPRSGTVHNSFDDLLVIASHTLPHKYANKLEPWDVENLIPYADDYLSGFGAESYQIDLEEGFGTAAGRMDVMIRRTIRSDIGGDVQTINHMKVHYDTITFKHILLPVWSSAFRYRGKVYRFLINGRTGEVQGERPWSWVKIVLLVLGILLGAGVLALIGTAIGVFR